MGWREGIGNFDLSRLTFIGWLVFLLAFATGIGAAIVVGTYRDSMVPGHPGSRPRRIGAGGIAGAVGAIGFFFAARAVLALAGVTTVRPKDDDSIPVGEQKMAELARRVNHATW